MNITIQIFYIDGSCSEFMTDDDIIQRLNALKDQGYKDKFIIHQLISDDFAAPPISVNIRGKLKNGMAIQETLYYQ